MGCVHPGYRGGAGTLYAHHRQPVSSNGARAAAGANTADVPIIFAGSRGWLRRSVAFVRLWYSLGRRQWVRGGGAGVPMPDTGVVFQLFCSAAWLARAGGNRPHRGNEPQHGVCSVLPAAGAAGVAV